jgi:hypothetical protein
LEEKIKQAIEGSDASEQLAEMIFPSFSTNFFDT